MIILGRILIVVILKLHDYMKIGIDIRVLMSKKRTGVGEYTFELLDNLFKIDKENQYYLFINSFKDVSDEVMVWRQDNVHYVIKHWPNKLFNLCQLILKWPKLDKITTHGLDYWFSPNLNFTVLSKRVKFILTVHDLSFEFFPDCFSWKRRLWHKILNPSNQCKRANLILAPSENTKRDVVSYYGIREDKVRAVYPGKSSEFRTKDSETIENLKNKYNLPNKFILYLGTLEPRKNIISLIDAYKKSQLSLDQCSLIIAGARGWKDTEILREIENTDGVHYIGYVDAEDKPTLYRAADLFVYPSLYEGFGFPVLEAMISGTPVITSNRSSLPEIGGNAVYLINPYNTRELASAMKSLLSKYNLRHMLVEKAEGRVEQFNWEKTAKFFLEKIML
ncbi:MAG: glycosyltransferase [Candidatus Magasanikbacteria bacterium]|nr:glycosyltransferase [Candidatus Magasanikbacteria bacterium]